MIKLCSVSCYKNICRQRASAILTNNSFLWVNMGSVVSTDTNIKMVIRGRQPTMALLKSIDLRGRTLTRINVYKVEGEVRMGCRLGTHVTLNTRTNTKYTARSWSRQGWSLTRIECMPRFTARIRVSQHRCIGFKRQGPLTSGRIMIIIIRRRARSVGRTLWTTQLEYNGGSANQLTTHTKSRGQMLTQFGGAESIQWD